MEQQEKLIRLYVIFEQLDQFVDDERIEQIRAQVLDYINHLETELDLVPSVDGGTTKTD